jgi:hypothetical protein
MSTPKETPVQFTSEMVRATLDGLKTQMRLVVDPQPNCEGGWAMHETDATGMWFRPRSGPIYPLVSCPLGKPGDRLWVQETYTFFDPDGPSVLYEADADEDGSVPYLHSGAGGFGGGVCSANVDSWNPAASMPRWASRILLEISSVRVERLREITTEGARAEGIGRDQCPDWHATVDFRALWDSLNSASNESWDANPFVWVIEFRLALLPMPEPEAPRQRKVSPIATRNEQPDFRSLCAELLTELQSMRKVIADEVGYPSPPSPLEERVSALLHNEN